LCRCVRWRCLRRLAYSPPAPTTQSLHLLRVIPPAPAAAAAKPLDFYRCEYGIEFTAKFVDNSVTLDSSRGYDILFKDSKASATPTSPSVTPVEYSNPRMNATFNLGVTGREAVLRYPLLPLVSRCVRE
jgi:hypothetical protein